MTANRRITSTGTIRLLVLLAVCVLLPSLAEAQNFERYRPKLPSNREGESKLPDKPAEATGDPKILVEELKAVIFVDHQDKVIAEAIDANGVQVRSDAGLEMLQTLCFQNVVEPYLGQPISLLRLNELVRDVIVFYRTNDQPVVDVSIPEQDVTDGVVQIVVTEGRVGEIRIDGACYFDPCYLVDQTCAIHHSKIYESVLLSDLRWLNRNPFREVDLELTPGKKQGETDIVFHVHDRLPLRVYAGYDDTGNRFTGQERQFYGFNLGNVFNRDHSFGYQFTSSSDFELLRAHSVVYEISLPNRDILTFFGSYAEVSSRIGFPFLQDGFSWQASGRYRHDLPPRCDYEHYITGGFDFKQTNTNLEFNAINFFESTADIAQLTFGYHGQLVRDRKSLVMGADVYISPGEFSPGNFDRDHRRLRAGAEAEYVYSRMYAELQLPVSCRLTFVSRITGQISEAPILPVEQLGFGGFDTIRGYDMRDINADSGYILNLELRTVPKPLGLQCDDQIQYLAFYDRGDALSRTVGSGKGVTTVLAKNDVIVTGRSSQAQIGFNGGSATGDIRVDAGRDVIVTALNAAAIAQIGHGGFEADANFSGNIAVLAGGDVNFESGANDEAYVQLGHGGIRSQGTFSGDINVSAGSISFTGGDGFGAYARLVHGGDNSEGNRTGNILVSSSGNLTFSGGMSQNAYAQLGHGGNEGDGDFMGTIDVTAVGLTFQGGTLNDTYAQLGHGGDNADGNHSGMITVNASGGLLFQAGSGSDSYPQLGHGGNDVDGTLTGNISVTAMNDITFSGGIGSEANAQLGHGGVFAFGDRSGDITINHANNLIFTGGEGRESYAQLGHGGTVGFGTQSGDITITRANNLVFRGGEGFFAYAQLGHGGAFTFGDQTGNITITQANNIVITGGEEIGAYAQLGHGGVGVDGEQSGSISILQANDLIVSGGAGENAYAQLGHGGTAVETESED